MEARNFTSKMQGTLQNLPSVCATQQTKFLRGNPKNPAKMHGATSNLSGAFVGTQPNSSVLENKKQCLALVKFQFLAKNHDLYPSLKMSPCQGGFP